MGFFLTWVKSNANQKQGNFIFNTETEVGPKRLEQAYTNLNVTTNTFDPNEEHFVYIIAYLANEPSFFTIYSQKVLN